MVDVIPGATYYDTVLQRECVCNGVFPQDDELDIVKLEYTDPSETIDVPFHLMLASDTFEIQSTPH